MELHQREITIPVNDSYVAGDLHIIEHSFGMIIFAHGSGSSRFSKRNQFVAHELNKARFSTFLFDLLTPEEDRIDQISREYRFDIPLLADRLALVTDWILKQEETQYMPIGYFGSSTGAAAALIAGAELKEHISAIVSRGGRPDLAKGFLPKVQAPTLLIVGEKDYEVILLNQEAFEKLTCEKELLLIPGATHLFEEEGTLEQVTDNTIDWFAKYLMP